MIALNPSKATKDFLDYLALASVSELRQLNVESVDLLCNKGLARKIKN